MQSGRRLAPAREGFWGPRGPKSRPPCTISHTAEQPLPPPLGRERVTGATGPWTESPGSNLPRSKGGNPSEPERSAPYRGASPSSQG